MFNRITFILILITFSVYAASGYLQNEDFKTESELLTAGGSKSQLLNDTKVYVTGNGINKTLDDAIVDGDIGAGGGGSAGINFITDASFEKETFAPTVSVAGGIVTYPTYTTNDKLYSEFNTKYYQVAHTGLSSANYSVNYSQARTGLDGKQGLFSIWAKVNADLDLCIELDASGNCESTVSLIADDTWRKYEIPFVFGASSVEFNFFNASLTGNITLQLDKAYIGTIPDGYIKQINSSELVRVRARKVNSQTLTDAVTSNIIYDDEVEDNYNAYNSTTGVFTCPKISKYRIGFNAYFQNLDSAGNTSTIELTVGSDSYALGRDRTVTTTMEHSSPPFDFECTSIGQTVIPKATCDNADNSNCNLRPSSGSVYFNTLSITELSNTEYDTIVSQNTELTAQTANEFSARIVSTGVVSQENYDFINGDCVVTDTSLYTCTLNSVNTQKLNCVANPEGPNRTVTMIGTNIDKVVLRSQAANSGSNATTNFQLQCSKNGIDVNKSATIIGKFENINSSDLISIAQTDVTAQSVNDATDTEIDGISYTITKASRYYIDAVSTLQTNATGYFRVDITKNTSVVSNYFVCNKENTNWISCRNNYIGNFEVGDVVKISVVQGTGGARNVNLSKLTIQELPDTESIIKNLSQEKTKCQTKYLSANVTASGTSNNSSGSYIAQLDDIEFNNLTVGKKYRVFLSPNLQASLTNVIALTALHNSNAVARFFCGNSAGTSICMGTGVGDFTASSTSLFMQTDNFTGTNPQLSGNGNSDQTHVRLCELPSTFVETTEW